MNNEQHVDIINYGSHSHKSHVNDNYIENNDANQESGITPSGEIENESQGNIGTDTSPVPGTDEKKDEETENSQENDSDSSKMEQTETSEKMEEDKPSGEEGETKTLINIPLEDIDRIQRKLEWLENNLPKIEKIFKISETYVDKINLGFADIMRNLAFFEERKDRILAAAKGFKVNFSLKQEDIDSIDSIFNEVIEKQQAVLYNQMTETKETFDKELKQLIVADKNIIKKVSENIELTDKLIMLKRRYIVAWATFGITFTVLMTVLCMTALGR